MQYRATWGKRWAFRLFRTPYSLFSFYLCAVATFMLVPCSPQTGMAYALVGPWFAVALLFLAFPFLGAAFRKFRMTKAEKRNHAMEHGTVFFLRQRLGKNACSGGRAFESGFRLSGIQNKADIPEAFAEMLDAVREGNVDCTVSNRCGSMIVVAQGLAVLLLTATWLTTAAVRFSVSVSLALLAVNICVFLTLRYPLGRWIQRRFLLSLDFRGAEIVSVRHVKDRKFYEKPSVVFVKTKTLEAHTGPSRV